MTHTTIKVEASTRDSLRQTATQLGVTQDQALQRALHALRREQVQEAMRRYSLEHAHDASELAEMEAIRRDLDPLEAPLP